MKKKTITGTRSEYINSRMKELYDSINLKVPKGKKETIKAAAAAANASVNEYIYTLICADLDGTSGSRLAEKKKGFTEEQRAMLDKWQVPRKYHEMIESMSYTKGEGYYIYLKQGYINDVTGSRTIHAAKTHDMRLMINKSHKVK